MKRTWLLMIPLILALAACGADTEVPDDSSASSPTSRPTHTSAPPSPTPDLGPRTDTQVIIDGYADDWEGYPVINSDDQEDQVEGTADLAEFKAFVNDRYLYVMVRFHELAYFDHLIFTLQTDGVFGYQLNVFQSGQVQLGSGGGSFRPIEMLSAYQEVLEFRIPLDSFSALPVRIDLVETYLPQNERRGDTLQGGAITFAAEVEPTDIQLSPRDDRPIHYTMADPSMAAGYLYRIFIQGPAGIEVGPDDLLYVADWNGRHIVRLAPDGTVMDLELWQNPTLFSHEGPLDITFDEQGRLYFTDGSRIYRLEDGGIVEQLDGVSGWPQAIDFGPDGALYYADVYGGRVLRLEIGGEAQVIGQLDLPRGIVVGQDGMVYVTRWPAGDVVRIDPNSGEMFEFQPGVCNFDPCYLSIDPEGDIWVRGIFDMLQFAPDGSEKPYSIIIDGQTIPGSQYGWHSSAGISFDSQGNLWIASYNSWVQYMRLTNPGDEEPVFELLPASPGLEASDLDAGPDGAIYATDLNGRQLLRIEPDGEATPLVEHGSAAREAVAVAQDGTIYYTAFGEIFRLVPGGTPTHFASVLTERMIVGGDGYLYASQIGDGGTRSIVRITGIDQVETVATELNGDAFENQEVYLARGPGEDLLVLVTAAGNVYQMSPDGSAILIGFVDTAYLAAASPTTGTMYFMSRYVLKSIDLDGNIHILGDRIEGDPWGMTVSPDGQYLYIAESGAIDRIYIGE